MGNQNKSAEFLLDPGATAMELVELYLEDAPEPPDAEEEQQTRTVVMLAAEYLAETAGPGRWDLFEPGGFFDRIDFMSDHDRGFAALILMGFYGWMFFRGRVPAGPCLRILASVREAAPPSPVLDEFYGGAKTSIVQMAATLVEPKKPRRRRPRLKVR